MAKFKYVARLGNGREVTRNSDRVYTHHWRAWVAGNGGDSGFARSYELASKAASSAAKLLRKRLGHMAKIESEIVEAKVTS
jgi:hypothetical protein